MLAKVRESKDENFGYDAGTDVLREPGDLGVIRPTKVTRTALRTAASIAVLLLTSECMTILFAGATFSQAPRPNSPCFPKLLGRQQKNRGGAATAQGASFLAHP